MGANLEFVQLDNIQPASLDACLDNVFLVEKHKNKIIDAANETLKYEEIKSDCFLLEPNQFILAATEEYIKVPENLTVMLAGKSTLARLGLQIHITAGWVDPGFEGKLTLEIVNNSSNTLELTAGMLIGQLVFIEMKKKPDNAYNGKYQKSKSVVGAKNK